MVFEKGHKIKGARKGTPCLEKGCDGFLRAKGSKISNRALVANYGFVYFPGDCRIRGRICNKCGTRFRTVEVPLDKYKKDLTLIHKLKGMLREYVED